MGVSDLMDHEFNVGKGDHMTPRHWATVVSAVCMALGLMGHPASAEVNLPPVLSRHMVLQQGMAVPVWGTAAVDEKVTVKFCGQEKGTVADSKGHWQVQLDALQAGGPHVMTIAGTNTLTLDNVLVGEVWVGSGQSNMELPVSAYGTPFYGNVFSPKDDEELIRMAAGTYPTLRMFSRGDPGWREATPGNIATWSALLFSFGLSLQRKLDVPVGLLVGASSSTASGVWLSEEAYASDAACKEVAARYAATYSFEEEQKRVQGEMVKYEQAKAEWEKLTPEQRKGRPAPWKPWPALRAGEFGWAGSSQMGGHYRYSIKTLMPFAIRGVLWDQGESGTGVQGVDQYTLMGALIRGWRKDWGQGDFPFIYVQKPSGGGCAWNSADPVTAKADPFSVLPATVPHDGTNREMHIRIMQYPKTAMVTSSDLGGSIHPVNKSGYGARASRVALGMAYGQRVEIYGPVYQSHRVEGSKVRISFSHVGQGLAFKHGDKLQGFAVAGKDMRFVWADAAIDGATVVVSSATVAEPVAVRYAWSEQHPWANLFNQDGLPALPFDVGMSTAQGDLSPMMSAAVAYPAGRRPD
jgi:sialate O-acetylesterase